MDKTKEEILKIVNKRIKRKQEPGEDFVSWNARKKEAESIKKAILRLPIV